MNPILDSSLCQLRNACMFLGRYRPQIVLLSLRMVQTQRAENEVCRFIERIIRAVTIYKVGLLERTGGVADESLYRNNRCHM